MIKTTDQTVAAKAVGTTLGVWTEQNYRIMSDVWGTAYWAYYWDRAEKRIASHIVHVTEGYGSGRSLTTDAHLADLGVVLDADEGVLEEIHTEYLRRWFLYEMAATRTKFQTSFAKGDIIKVVKGRQFVGVEGRIEVIIMGNYGFGRSARAMRKFGIPTSEEKIEVEKNGRKYLNYKHMAWAWEHNVQKQNCPEPDAKAIFESCTAAANGLVDSISKRVWINPHTLPVKV